MTVMVTALTIGLGIDYSIHVWRRFEAMKSKEGDVWSGLREMYASTGVAPPFYRQDNCLWIQCSLDVTNAGCARIWIGDCDYGILLAGSGNGVATRILDS